MRIQVLSHDSDVEIGKACTRGIGDNIHEYIELLNVSVGEIRFRTITYALQVPVNYTTGMEIIKALRDVR